jgi:hypothetical protein
MFLLYLLGQQILPFSIFSVFVPNLIATGMNLLYLFRSSLILASSLSESSAMCKIISVPLVVLSAGSRTQDRRMSSEQQAHLCMI